MTGIDMDGIHYNVRCKFDTLDRSFRLVEGVNAGDMLSGRHERDLTGTYYDYSLYVEPEPKDRAAYDSFYQAISAPINSHSVTLPYGQSTITFDAMVSDGTDRYKGKVAGERRWTGLQVNFSAIKPQRTP
jgi:hypothetical protein